MVKPVVGYTDNGQLTTAWQRRLPVTLPPLASLASIVNTSAAEPAPLLPGRSSQAVSPPVLLSGSLRDISSLFREPLSPPPLQPDGGSPLPYAELSQDLASMRLSGPELPFSSAIPARRSIKRSYTGRNPATQKKTGRKYAESAEAIQRRALEANPQRTAQEQRRRMAAKPQRQPSDEPPRQLPQEQQSQQLALQTFIHDMTQYIPHIADKVLKETRLLHIQTLQSLAGKEAWSPAEGEAIKQALQHFMAIENQQRLNSLIKIRIIDNPNLCAADKRVLLTRIQENIGALRPVSTLIPGYRANTHSITLAELTCGLTHDFIALLEKFGITITELSTYLYTTTIAAEIVHHDVLGLINDEIEEALANEKLPQETLAAMQDLATSFCHSLDKIAPVLGPDRDYPDQFVMHHIRETRPEHYPAENMDYLNPLDEFRGREAEGISIEKIVEYRELRILQINYLRCAPLLELFKQVIQHDASIVERSLMNEEQRKLFTASQLKELKTILISGARERAEQLLQNGAVLPFVFGDSLQPLALNTEEQRYAGRGLPFSLIDSWLNNPSLSEQQFLAITRYLNDRLEEITTTGGMKTDWITALSDTALVRLFRRSSGFTSTGYYDNSTLVTYDAVKEIGKAIIGPHFYFQHLAEFTEYVRQRSKIVVNADSKTRAYLLSASHNELACLLFQNLSRNQITLPWIAENLRADRDEGRHEESIKRHARNYLDRFIVQSITAKALRALRTPTHIRDELNNQVPQHRVLSFIARRFNTTIIEEDSEQDFQRLYTISGETSDEPPVDRQDAIIIRPGVLIPLAMDGVQQATIELERNDNHHLLQELVRYLKQQEGVVLDDKNLTVLVMTLGNEILQSERAENSDAAGGNSAPGQRV